LEVVVVAAFVEEFAVAVVAGDAVAAALFGGEGGEEDLAVHVEEEGRVEVVLRLGVEPVIEAGQGF
jgi:hypothetical protein